MNIAVSRLAAAMVQRAPPCGTEVTTGYTMHSVKFYAYARCDDAPLFSQPSVVLGADVAIERLVVVASPERNVVDGRVNLWSLLSEAIRRILHA